MTTLDTCKPCDPSQRREQTHATLPKASLQPLLSCGKNAEHEIDHLNTFHRARHCARTADAVVESSFTRRNRNLESGAQLPAPHSPDPASRSPAPCFCKFDCSGRPILVGHEVLPSGDRLTWCPVMSSRSTRVVFKTEHYSTA